MSGRVATERLYRTVDDEVVSEGDPRAAFLLAGIGDEIPEGYTAPRGASSKEAEQPENKAVTRAANKGKAE